MAILIPAEVKSNIPNARPNGPKSFALSIAPWINRCPKDVIGTMAPAPQYRTNLSYMPNISRNAPIITKREVI